MKAILSGILFSFGTLSAVNAQLMPAEDWTQTDCDGISHHLFTELDEGKVVLMEIVMLEGCMPCINAAHFMAPVIEQYNAEYDNRIQYYSFGYNDTYSCSELLDWKTSNEIACSAQFTEGAALATYYGGMGMPTIVVAGRSSHVVCFNQFGFGPNDTTDLANAFDYALGLTENLSLSNYQKKFSVYPNPAQNILHILSDAPSNFSIKNMAGVTQMEITSTQQVDISRLPAGMYMCIAHGDTVTQPVMFVKN